MKSFVPYLLLVFPLFSFENYFRHGGTDPALSPHQREVINYFKEVALGFEYGTASGLTRKWQTTMKIFISGEPSEAVLQELRIVIEELNGLATDGFRIEIATHKEESNFHLFFGSRNAFTSMYPADTETVKHSSGIFRIFWNKSNYINRGYAFIHTATTEEEQRHAVREELTQALGLGRDSPMYDDSIFQSRWTLPTTFAEIDRQVIRCLYNPRMQVGLNQDQVDAALTEILLAPGSTL
jgi:hypothetical protein